MNGQFVNPFTPWQHYIQTASIDLSEKNIINTCTHRQTQVSDTSNTKHTLEGYLSRCALTIQTNEDYNFSC